MDSRIYQDPDKADADEVLDLSDDVAQQAQSVSQLQALVESQAQEVQALQAQLSSLSQTLTSLQAQVAGMAPSVDKIPSIEESVTELSAGQSSQDSQIQGINSQLSGVESDVASLRDSLSRTPVIGNGVKLVDVSYSDGRPVLRVIDAYGVAYHLIMEKNAFKYFTCLEDGSEAQIWQIVPSPVEVNANLSRVKFLDVNNRGCPGFNIVTDDGHEYGIYAQEGLGFILYDYTEHRRAGLCPFS